MCPNLCIGGTLMYFHQSPGRSTVSHSQWASVTSNPATLQHCSVHTCSYTCTASKPGEWDFCFLSYLSLKLAYLPEYQHPELGYGNAVVPTMTLALHNQHKKCLKPWVGSVRMHGFLQGERSINLSIQ